MLFAQSPQDPATFLQWIADAGPTAILAFVIVGFLKEWIVPGPSYRKMQLERDRALELVYKQAGLTERAVDVSVQRLELEEQLLELRKRDPGSG